MKSVTESKVKTYLMNTEPNWEKSFKNILAICSSQTKNKFARISRIISRNHRIELDVRPFETSYSTMRGTNVYICIDPMMAYSPGDSLEALYAKCLGIVAHEAGHIAYSDFNVVGDNNQKMIEWKAKIQSVGTEILQIQKGIIPGDEEQKKEELRNTIYNYVYHVNLPDMLNSVEDANIEFSVAAEYPKYYGPLCEMRNHIFKKEKEALAKYTGSEDVLSSAISEIRQYGVIAYREQFTPHLLPRYFSQSDINKMQQYAFYCRAATDSTQERNTISKVLMDMLEPLVREKADEFYFIYMDNLNTSEEELLDESLFEEMASGTPELTLNKKMNSSLAGKTSPRKPASKYEMDLPSDMEEEIKQKQKEENQGDNSQPSSGEQQGDSSDSQSYKSEESSETSSGNSEGNSDSQDNEKTTGNEEDKSEGSSSVNEPAESEDNTSSGSDDSHQDSTKDSDENTGENAGGSQADEPKSMEPLSFEEEKAKAAQAMKENLSKLEKEFEKEKIKDIKNDIGDTGGSGKAPTLERLGSPDSITEAHKGIKCHYHKANLSVTGMSQNGLNAYASYQELTKQANQFSRKLKEILMYQAKTRRKNGLRAGKIHDAALSRIVTDQRVFRKTIQGVEKKARIGVLLDLSGSMSGKKLENAIKAGYMLSEACAKVKIPISIMGHYDNDNVELIHFVEFENYLNKEERKNIFSARATCCNRDGLAIFQGLTDLVRHRKKDEKLVYLIISDGAPSGSGNYYGEYAEKDIQHIIDTFEKQYNVKSIGIGIGSDTDHVPHIYKNNVIVPNVAMLSDELLKILKSIII